MPTRPTTVAFAFLLLFIAGPPALAQADATPQAERIAELEQENDRLRQELAELRLELAQLRRTMEREVEDGDDDGMTNPVEADSDGTETEMDQRAGAEAENSEEVPTFGSVDQIFRSIPPNHRPARDGWDLPQRLAVEEWLVKNISGSRFEARLEIRHVSIGYSTTREEWRVALHFTRREMNYMSWDVEQRITEITLYGDRAFADRARRIEEGARVHVTGTIASASWGLVIGQVADAEWKPKYYELRLEDANVRSPHLRR